MDLMKMLRKRKAEMNLKMSKKRKKKAKMDVIVLKKKIKAVLVGLNQNHTHPQMKTDDIKGGKKILHGFSISRRKKAKRDRKMARIKKAKMEMKMKKKAVLIGLKHPNLEMNANIDIKGQLLRMKDQLIKLRGFSEHNITLMVEQDDEGSISEFNIPNSGNIRITLCYLLDTAKPGDIIFIHLIAYGCSDGLIMTADKNHIEDSYFRAVICSASHSRCHLTFVSDCFIEPTAVCPCPPKELHHERTEEEIQGRMRRVSPELSHVFRNHPACQKGYCEVAYRMIVPTGLSSVNILQLKQEKTHEDDDDVNNKSSLHDSSLRVFLLTPYQRDTSKKDNSCSRETTQKDEDNSPDTTQKDEDEDNSPDITQKDEDNAPDITQKDEDNSPDTTQSDEDNAPDTTQNDEDSSTQGDEDEDNYSDSNQEDEEDGDNYSDSNQEDEVSASKDSSPQKNEDEDEDNSSEEDYDVSELFFPLPEGVSSTTTSQPTLYGGFTKAILDVMEETHGQVTNLELAQKAMEKLGTKPGLSCSDHHHAYASFVC